LYCKAFFLVLCSRRPLTLDSETQRRVVITQDDFIEFEDAALGVTRFGKVEGLFVHQFSGHRRVFIRIQYVSVSDEHDQVLDSPYLSLDGPSAWTLIGLPRVRPRNIYVIELEGRLIWITWTNVKFL